MFKLVPLTIPSRVFIPLIPLKTLTPTPQNPYPWSRVRVFWGKGKGSSGMTPGLPLTILNCVEFSRGLGAAGQGEWYRSVGVDAFLICQGHSRNLAHWTLFKRRERSSICDTRVQAHIINNCMDTCEFSKLFLRLGMGEDFPIRRIIKEVLINILVCLIRGIGG